jgi:hypothetical protein
MQLLKGTRDPALGMALLPTRLRDAARVDGDYPSRLETTTHPGFTTIMTIIAAGKMTTRCRWSFSGAQGNSINKDQISIALTSSLSLPSYI